MPETRRVVVVEDHPLMRRAVEELLLGAGYAVVGVAEGYSKGLERIEATTPDVVVADLSLGAEDGCDLIRAIKERWPAMPVAVFSMHMDQVHIQRALLAGATAYVAKSELAGALLEGIEEALEGRNFLSPRLVPLMVRDWMDSRAVPARGSPLSPKELEVIRLFGEGYSVREIASRLGRSHKTVETYCARMKKKLGLTSNRDLLRHAIETLREGAKPLPQGPRG